MPGKRRPGRSSTVRSRSHRTPADSNKARMEQGQAWKLTGSSIEDINALCTQAPHPSFRRFVLHHPARQWWSGHLSFERRSLPVLTAPAGRYLPFRLPGASLLPHEQPSPPCPPGRQHPLVTRITESLFLVHPLGQRTRKTERPPFPGRAIKRYWSMVPLFT